MEKNIKDYQYNNSPVDRKLRSFVEKSCPKHMDINAIKQKTYVKIREEKRRVKRHRFLLAAAATVCLLVVAGAGMLFFSQEKQMAKTRLIADVKKVDLKEVLVPRGDRMTIMLSDGTKVIANSRTKVSYPSTFTGDTRKIYVKGEAYLEVAHDVEHPFIVSTDQFDVKVLGTRFNISNYDSSASNVVLVQGSVELITANKDVVRMKPSDKVEILDGSFASKTQVDTQDYTCWMDGIMNLHGEDINTIAKKLSLYYGVDIVCDGNSSTPLYGKLVLQSSVGEVLQSIDKMAKVKTVEKGNTIYLIPNN